MHLARLLVPYMKKAVMRVSLILLTSLGLLAATPAQQDTAAIIGKNAENLPVINHDVFQKGEKLTYKVAYGWIEAGTAVIEVKDEEHTIGGRDVLHIVGTGESRGAFDWFFKVRDRYETYLDEEGVFPWMFVRSIEEGSYKKKQDYTFYQTHQKVRDNKGKTFQVPEVVQDMISSFYYSRTLDFSNAKKGDLFTIPTFVDNEYYPLQIKYLGTENIKVAKGKFNCMKFVPVVQKGRIFEDEEDMMVWITNDENKIPILAKAKILVGSIRAEIEDYEGLANPIAKIK